MARLLVASAIVVLSSMCVGCAGGSRSYPVSGLIEYEDGKPARELSGGTVTYTSDELKVSISGDIDEEGRYRLSAQGAPPGTYQVTVSQADDDGGEDDRPKKRRAIDARYAETTTTPLKKTVAAENNEIKLTVSRPKGKG